VARREQRALLEPKSPGREQPKPGIDDPFALDLERAGVGDLSFSVVGPETDESEAVSTAG
jgi:hypothetical protein